MIYLPKNATSRLQPLDAGIIQNFKCHYRKLLIKHTLGSGMIDSQSNLTAYDIAKTVDILTAIRMIKQAWDEVCEDTVIKGCGALPNSTIEDVDPNLDSFVDIDEELGELVHQVNPAMSVSEYLHAEEDLPTCCTIPEGVRAEELREYLRGIAINEQLTGVTNHPNEEPDEGEDNNNDDDDDDNDNDDGDNNDIDIIELQPTMKSFENAIAISEDLLHFLTDKGEEGIADHLLKVIKVLNDAKWQQIKMTKQTTLLDYYSTQ